MPTITLHTTSGSYTTTTLSQNSTRSQLIAFMKSIGHDTNNIEFVGNHDMKMLSNDEIVVNNCSMDVYNIVPKDDDFRNHVNECGFNNGYFLQSGQHILLPKNIFGNKYPEDF